MPTKIKLYSDRAYKADGTDHVPMLYPFWGANAEDPESVFSGRYDLYAAVGNQYFEMTSLEEADLAVAPASWETKSENQRLTEQLIEVARKAGKRTVVFFWHDSAADVPLENILLMRASFYRSSRKPYEFALPSWSEDFVERYFDGKLPIVEKTQRPIVGFCGHAQLPNPLREVAFAARSQVKKWLKRRPTVINPGAILRGVALQKLSHHKGIQANFVIRKQFLGGARFPNGRVNPERMKEVRAEFVQNMAESQYVLCLRGMGNFSYRLYETLSCGRIPVFINTDSVLPYDFAVDWKQYCVWVEESEINSIAEKVVDFHNKISPQDFVDLQRECRRFWQEWLSPEGFFQHFHYHLQDHHQAQRT